MRQLDNTQLTCCSLTKKPAYPNLAAYSVNSVKCIKNSALLMHPSELRYLERQQCQMCQKLCFLRASFLLYFRNFPQS